jgi:hypothetical protein
MRVEFPENFSENGARPVQILGCHGRLIGWARSFSDFMTVTDNTIVGGSGRVSELTRIAGRDVSKSDGHTVGKTFSRKDLWQCQRPHPWATSAQCASNHIPAPARDGFARLDPATAGRHKLSCLQNGARETGLGHWLPGFLRSNVETHLQPQLTSQNRNKSNKNVDVSHSRNSLFGGRMYLTLRG